MKFIKTIAFAIASFSAFAATSVQACNEVYYQSSVTPTGSRISGSGAAFVLNGTYSSGVQVDIDGTFVPNFNTFDDIGFPQQIMAAYINGTTWYARNASGWQSWDGTVANLPVITAIPLPHGSSPITVSSLSQSLPAGSYQVFFGYKWGSSPTCQWIKVNQSPIAITIQ